MSERDELAAMRGELAELTADAAERDDDDWMTEAADAILAAGYRRPRTITTTEELDTLPDGVIIMDGRGSCREGLRTMGGGNVWRAMGPAKVLRSKEIALPATVLHEGSAS